MRYVLFYAAHKMRSTAIYALKIMRYVRFYAAHILFVKNIYLMYIFIANKFIEIYAGFMRFAGFAKYEENRIIA